MMNRSNYDLTENFEDRTLNQVLQRKHLFYLLIVKANDWSCPLICLKISKNFKDKYILKQKIEVYFQNKLFMEKKFSQGLRHFLTPRELMISFVLLFLPQKS